MTSTADQESVNAARTDLDAAAWDLSHLLARDGTPGPDAESPAAEVEVRAFLNRADVIAEAFAERHEGKVKEIDGAALIEAMNSLAELSDLVGRAANFAHLRFAADTEAPANGALVQMVTERGTAINTKLLFFDLEWVALCDDHAKALLATEGLDFARHHLELERRYRPHVLTAPEERIVSELSVTGAGAWDRLFDELSSAIRVDLPSQPEPVALDLALSQLVDPDQEVRRTTAEAVTEALEPGLRTRGYIFNTLLQNKSIGDRLRSYPTWISTRNLSNEATDDSVQALVEAVRGRYELARRWYRVKARLLGIERLADYDRMAAITPDAEEIPWAEAVEIVQDAFDSLSPEAGDVIARFFDEHWIDAPPRPGKRGGAFSASAVPGVHPYVMLNYTGKRRDVLTVAHELGHGIHQYLGGRKQGIFHQSTPLTVAETASVFGEQLVFGRLLGRAEDPASRLALLAEAVEGQIATVFRQIAMNQFEDRVHTTRRQDGELSVERFGELWFETQTEMLGDSVEITEGYRSWWSYVPHFIGSPGYVYAYAYGQLLALSVYRLYTEKGDEVVPAYLEMLAAGGSRSPEELGRIVGIDLADPSFWDNGLDLVEEQITEAETAAEAVLGGNA